MMLAAIAASRPAKASAARAAARVGDRLGGHLPDRAADHAHRLRARVEAPAVAGRARPLAEQAARALRRDVLVLDDQLLAARCSSPGAPLPSKNARALLRASAARTAAQRHAMAAWRPARTTRFAARAARAPSALSSASPSGRLGSAISVSGSKVGTLPMPSQLGHAPWRLLKENRRGSSAS